MTVCILSLLVLPACSPGVFPLPGVVLWAVILHEPVQPPIHVPVQPFLQPALQVVLHPV